MPVRQSWHTEVVQSRGQFLMAQSDIEWGNGIKICKMQQLWTSGVIHVLHFG